MRGKYKFKLEDKVRVIVQPEGTTNNMIGLTGKIADIDEEWMFPYEVEWDDGLSHDGICLFDDDGLELVNDVNTVTLQIPDVSTQYINIKFQEGAIQEHSVNGAQIEEVIDLLVSRLEGFQKGNFPCRENALAITKLEEARMWLNERTRKRKEQGVEGKNEKHE